MDERKKLDEDKIEPAAPLEPELGNGAAASMPPASMFPEAEEPTMQEKINEADANEFAMMRESMDNLKGELPPILGMNEEDVPMVANEADEDIVPEPVQEVEPEPEPAPEPSFKVEKVAHAPDLIQNEVSGKSFGEKKVEVPQDDANNGGAEKVMNSTPMLKPQNNVSLGQKHKPRPE